MCPAETRRLRVCYFGAYRAEYSRNQIMIEGLRRNGVEVIECHEPLWGSVDDRVEVVKGGWRKPAFWRQVLRTYGRLIRCYQQTAPHDVLIVGYPGQLDVFLARLLSWRRGIPLVWDVFMSLYLIALERGLDRKAPLTVKLLAGLERVACRLPDLLILDTAQYVAWFEQTHGVAATRFGLVPTGADDRIFRPQPLADEEDVVFRVTYYGAFIPNHGVETIVGAAALLADDPSIRFELIGQGPDREAAALRIAQQHLTHVTLTDWLPQAELVQRVAHADVCLGAFGVTPQSLMTIQNKVYEGLAMARPVITGDSPALRDAMQHGVHIFLCERASPQALVYAIKTLQGDPALRARLASAGYALFAQQYTIRCIGERFVLQLQRVVPASLAESGITAAPSAGEPN
jgi:glycosyltransferase involved in cell wall biosynthesis